MKILIKTLSVALAVSIPFTCFCIGVNIVTRMPDVYQYEFKATDALKSFDFNKNNDEMGEFISDFMIGKEKQFQIIAGDEDRPQAVFSENEMLAAATARKYVNIIAIVGLFFSILTVVSIVVMKRYELDKEIRKKFNMGAIIYAGLLLTYLIGFFIMAKTGHYMCNMLSYTPMEEDVLPGIMTAGLTTRIYFSIAGVSTIVIAILGYIIYKLTAPKRIFSRNY
ncbi:MAG: hypothetical protein ACK5MV_01020 [Aminipila sp.]